MPYLVRKIMRNSNLKKLENQPLKELNNITADVTTNEFRSTAGELSVWLIDSLEELDQAALAISLSGSRIEDIQVMIIDLDYIKGSFLINKSPGKTLAKNLVDMHRDICGITHKSLDELLLAYKQAVDKSMHKRYKTKFLREMIKEEIQQGRVDIESAVDEMADDLSALAI